MNAAAPNVIEVNDALQSELVELQWVSHLTRIAVSESVVVAMDSVPLTPIEAATKYPPQLTLLVMVLLSSVQLAVVVVVADTTKRNEAAINVQSERLELSRMPHSTPLETLQLSPIVVVADTMLKSAVARRLQI